MDNLDTIIKETMRNATETPPREVWETVSARLPKHIAHGNNKRPRHLAIAGLCVAGLAVATWGVVAPFLAQQPTPPQPLAEATIQTAPTESPRENNITLIDSTRQVAPIITQQREDMKATPPVSIATPSAIAPHTGTEYDFNPPTDELYAGATTKTTVDSTADDIEIPASTVTKLSPSSNTNNMTGESAEVPRSTGAATKQQVETPDLLIPSLLTPNGDGINDCWVIPGLEQYGRAQVQIYTAQSQRVYSNNDYHNDFCGNGLPEGNYFYILILQDYHYSRRGVFVIRK